MKNCISCHNLFDYLLDDICEHRCLKCSKLNKHCPGCSDINDNALIGLQFHRLGKYEDAIEWYDKAIESNLFDSDSYFKKAKSLIKLDKFDEAVTCFDSINQIEPLVNHVYKYKGLVLNFRLKFKDAILCFDQSIQFNRSRFLFDIDSYFNKGLALFRLNKFEEAIKCFDKVIQIDPAKQLIYLFIGYALDRLNKLEGALQSYTEAIRYDPNNFKAYNNRGTVFCKLKKYEEAIHDYDKAYELNPFNYESMFNKCDVLYELNKYKEAQECKAKLPVDSPAYFNKTIGLMSIKDCKLTEHPLEFSNYAFATIPDLYYAYLTKAIMLAELKKIEDASECFVMVPWRDLIMHRSIK
jgi:tetratricopeptide (TPR) repeat protein